MNKSQRIRIDLNDTTSKNIKVRLQQDVDTLEILSLEMNQKNAYQSFNANYGVIVGRVIANGGVGVPNAKISIFIPISDIDQNNSNIYAVYPYTSVSDKNSDGKRYNLLPRVAKKDPNTGTYKPKQPFGSFPIKEEFVTNDSLLEVYEKYYKYTTVTNDVGDYMLFGVPIGVQTVHMSVDITDIGKYSMTPSTMVTQLGYSPNLFTNNGTEIKPSNDLDDLPNIETQEIAVDVIPFWGDTTNFEIGITRQDFRVRASIASTFVVFGSHFTLGPEAVFGSPEDDPSNTGFYKISHAPSALDTSPRANLDARINRIGKLNVRVFTYPSTITQDAIDYDLNPANSGTTGITINTKTDIVEVDANSFYQFNDDGQFLLEIPCNRRKVITDEFGNEIVVADDSVNGVFTQFLGMMFFSYEDLSVSITGDKWQHNHSNNYGRLQFKFPQGSEATGNNFGLRDYNKDDISSDEYYQSEIWRKNYYKFEGGKIYGIAQFFATQAGLGGANGEGGVTNYIENVANYQFNTIIGGFRTSGTTDYLSGTTYNYDAINSSAVTGGYKYDFPSNIVKTLDNDTTYIGAYFGGNWLNFSMYFPQIAWTYTSNDGDMNVANTWFQPYKKDTHSGNWFVQPNGGSNQQHLFAQYYNTRFVNSRAEAMQTTFVEVPKPDLVQLNLKPKKGINKYDDFGSTGLTGNYKYRIPIMSQFSGDGTDFGHYSGATDYRYTNGTYSGASAQAFFFKGMYDKDCIKLLFDLNFV